jgi:hypothetical protein
MPIITIFPGTFCNEDIVLQELIAHTGYKPVTDSDLTDDAARLSGIDASKISRAFVCLLNLGVDIENGALRPKYVLKDIDEGDAYVDEVVQTDKFLNTIRQIKAIHEENKASREKLFASELDSDEIRKIRRGITRKNTKIFDLLKDWRLEGNIVDKIEQIIRNQIDWFDSMNKMLALSSETVRSAPAAHNRRGHTERVYRTRNPPRVPGHPLDQVQSALPGYRSSRRILDPGWYGHYKWQVDGLRIDKGLNQWEN